MSVIAVGIFCGSLVLGAVIVRLYVKRYLLPMTPPVDFSEMNLGIWATGQGLELARSRKMASVGDRAAYSFVAESEDGRRGWGSVIVQANGIDSTSGRVEVVWQQAIPPVRARRQLHDDPLWDDGLDGGPVARIVIATSDMTGKRFDDYWTGRPHLDHD